MAFMLYYICVEDHSMEKQTIKKVNKTLEITFSILSIIAGLLLANQIFAGWVIFFVASVLGMSWGIRTKNHYVAIMYAFFTIINGMGIYNYLISPLLV